MQLDYSKITASVDGVLRDRGHIHPRTDQRLRVLDIARRIRYTDPDIIKAIELFEENFS